jgi:hypothetical protein
MLEKRPTFFIKKNSTLPVLRYVMTEWVREKYGITKDMLDDCAVTFSMYDVVNDVYKIANKAAILEIENHSIDPTTLEYVLAYKFSISDTSKAGQFDGEFKIDFLGDHCGKITLPTTEKIRVVIQDSITKTTVV